MTANGEQRRRLRIFDAAETIDNVKLTVEDGGIGGFEDADLIVEVACAGVNPSDAKAAIGMMPYAVWPRTPGRDFAGRIVEGPGELLGQEVWGSSGDFGIRCNGSHATHIGLRRDCVAIKPTTISLVEAGAAGVPFVTAWEALTRATLPEQGETLVVFGANGKVGQAAVQIATMLGARVIGVVRGDGVYIGHANADIEIINSDREDVPARIREITDGAGSSIALNTVGSPYFASMAGSLAKRGRAILIGTIEKVVPFDILQFYRGQFQYYGIDTLALDTKSTIDILARLTPHFESGHLRPFPVGANGLFGLDDAAEAYARVLRSDRDRVVLIPA